MYIIAVISYHMISEQGYIIYHANPSGISIFLKQNFGELMRLLLSFLPVLAKCVYFS